MRRKFGIAALTGVTVLLLPGSAEAAVGAQVVVGGPTPFGTTCNGAPQTGTLTPNAKVEPFIRINPDNPRNMIGVWQQDRWSNGGAQGLLAGVSFDGGRSFQRFTSPPFSRCAGGNAGNGGDWERVSDPWVTISPDGTAYFIALPFNDSNIANGVTVARSKDGGRTWGPITTLIRDEVTSPDQGSSDKQSITADPQESNFAYAVWDRLAVAPDNITSFGPTYFTRTTDGGATWEPARPIYDPGPNNQTIGNEIVVLPDGTLLNAATVFIGTTIKLGIMRSTDKGKTWSAPTFAGDMGSVGVTDPRDKAPVRTGDIIPSVAVDPREGHKDVYAVWQDARFTGGKADGVVLSRSSDGGNTWSTPVRVSPPASGQAFTASVIVDSSGALAITYYDFTNNTGKDNRLLTDAWIVRSPDGGRTFEPRERLTPTSFDMRRAPNARGFFVGDYTGLDTFSRSFQTIYAQTTATNPTDMIAQRATAHAGPPATSEEGVDRSDPLTGGPSAAGASALTGVTPGAAKAGRPVTRH